MFIAKALTQKTAAGKTLRKKIVSPLKRLKQTANLRTSHRAENAFGAIKGFATLILTTLKRADVLKIQKKTYKKFTNSKIYYIMIIEFLKSIIVAQI